MRSRRIKLLVLFFAALVIAAFFDASSSITPRSEWTVTEGITLRLAQDTYPIGVKSMTLVLENHTERVVLYGKGWSFERNIAGFWVPVAWKPNIAFTMEGYILEAYDKKTMVIPTDILNKTLSPGRYRVTGHTLRVADDGTNTQWSGQHTDYPAYRLEFEIRAGAAGEPEAASSPAPGLWELPGKEEWQWYTLRDSLAMYNRSGMNVWQYIEMAGGFVAYLYRGEEDGEYLGEDDKLMLDIFDRATGERYTVFDGLTVEQDDASAADGGGLNIRTDNGAFYADVIDGKLIVKSLA